MSLFRSKPPLPHEKELEVQAADVPVNEANHFFEQGICPHCHSKETLRDGPEGGACMIMDCTECGETWNTMGGRYIHELLGADQVRRLQYNANRRLLH